MIFSPLLSFLLVSWYNGAVERERPTQTESRFEPLPYKAKKLPVLVVGGTGRVGRKVVEQLLAIEIPTRALVRDFDKAVDVLGKEVVLNKHSQLQVVVGDVNDRECVERAVKGCEALISVSGTYRQSEPTDWLPWRLFNTNIRGWCKDTKHPFYTDYVAQRYLVKMAEKHQLKKIIRLTNLSVGLPVFSWFVILQNLFDSMKTRYHYLCEGLYRRSKITSVILRPARMTDEERNEEQMGLLVDPSGTLPSGFRASAAIISRADVASLAVAASQLEDENSYTLAVGWATTDQGKQIPAMKNAKNALEKLKYMEVKEEKNTRRQIASDRPYGAAVAFYLYPFFAAILSTIYTTRSLLLPYLKPRREVSNVLRAIFLKMKLTEIVKGLKAGCVAIPKAFA